MTNKNEYISKMLKNDEYIENLTTKTIKNINDFKQMKPKPIKQVKDTHLIDRINKKIENEKSVKEHYKSLGYYGLPITNVDENIKFINTSMTEPVGKEIEREFDSLLGKYIKEPSMLQLLKNKIDDDVSIDDKNFMKELVFNFARYEPEIKKYSNRHVSMTLFYEFLKSILLEALNKKYPVGVDENKKPEFLGNDITSINGEAGRPTTKKVRVRIYRDKDGNVINSPITQEVKINDLNEFNNLMSEYFDDRDKLNQLNKLIDNDKSIKKDIFRRQFITDFLEFKDAVEKHSKNINDDEATIYTFYEFLKQFLINKNDLVTTVGNYNIEEKYGTNDVMSQYEQLQLAERKKQEVNRTLEADSKEVQQRKSTL